MRDPELTSMSSAVKCNCAADFFRFSSKISRQSADSAKWRKLQAMYSAWQQRSTGDCRPGDNRDGCPVLPYKSGLSKGPVKQCWSQTEPSFWNKNTIIFIFMYITYLFMVYYLSLVPTECTRAHTHTHTHTHTHILVYIYMYMCIYTYIYTQGVPRGMCQTLGGCSLC